MHAIATPCFGVNQLCVAAHVTKSIASALAFLHKQHRLHRDLKSDNIILGIDGEVKLTDFGFSAQLTQERPRRTSRCGTTAWMA